MEKTSTGTITDSSFRAFLHKNGSFFLESVMYIKKACSFFFDLGATSIQCDDQGLRYSCPSDQVQLCHISGQLN
jgi:hypothetical protein